MRGFVLLFTLSRPPSDADRWLGQDKVQHFFTSAFVQGFSYASLRAAGVQHGVALAGATAVTATVGIGKELRDARTGGDPSAKDLVWDAAGAGAATALLVRVGR